MKNTIKIFLTLFISLSIIIILFIECGGRKQDHSETQQNLSAFWQYPIQLGDSRAKVHDLLGAAARITPELEEYPLSGISVSFDGSSRVMKLWFAGSGCTVYSGYDVIQHDPLPTEHQIIFGITGKTNESEFRQILGVPQRESQEGRAAIKELRCIWRNQGYLINALFLIAERNQENKIFSKGTLVWFEITRAI